MIHRPMRRAKGTRSIRQRTNGSWQVRYDGPPDADGNPVKLSKTVRGSRRDAERTLRDKLGTIEDGSYVQKTKQTMAEYLQRWLDTYAATNTSLRTQQGYRVNVRRIVPFIGNIQLQGLQPHHIQRMYATPLDGGLSARTVHHTHAVLRGALNRAVKWGLVVRNVAQAVDPPRPQEKEIEVWDTETLHIFFDRAEASRFRDLYHLTVLTGMRGSEIAGLKWEHVDLGKASLSVATTLHCIVGHGLVEGQPKRKSSKRKITLSATTVTLLQRVKRSQLEQRLAAGPAWQDTGYVFNQPDGSPIDADRISRDFAKDVRESGLPHLTFHGLRHAHATMLLKAGVHPKVVSERLGHSKIGLTMDTYSHVLPDMQEAAAKALDEQLAIGWGG